MLKFDNCNFAGDVKDWFIENDIPNTIVRYWDLKSLEEDACYGYIKQIINLGNGKWILGIVGYDEIHPDGYPYMEYYPMEDLQVAISKDDQE